ncbi:MAG: IS630 family transposase [Chloroflexota bacterium]
MANHPASSLAVGTDERAELETWARSRVLSQRQNLRARIVLRAGQGVANETIARELGVSRPTVIKWRERFREAGLAGLEEAPGRGKRFAYDQGLEDRVISTTLQGPPQGSNHWSTRTLAAQLGIGHMTVQRIWRKRRLQPHRSQSFKLSTDPKLVEKVTDIVGLYLHPPEKAIVLCVDEKSKIHALDRTQPLLPMREGQPERGTLDYKRHGTTTLFAALDIATGAVAGRCYLKHRHQEFLNFLELLAQTYPRQELHLVLDNYATHKHPAVRGWLRRHTRIHLHYTPTSDSWMKQVELWFSLLHQRAIRRGVFKSLSALINAIHGFLEAWNENCAPFAWIKTADQSLVKANRQRLPATAH